MLQPKLRSTVFLRIVSDQGTHFPAREVYSQPVFMEFAAYTMFSTTLKAVG